MNHLTKKLFNIFALSELDIATMEELLVGIDDSFLLMYLMACQKLLQVRGFKWLKYADFASLSFDTNWLRAIRYLSHISALLLLQAFR